MLALCLLGAGALLVGVIALLASTRSRVPALDTLDEGPAILVMLGAAALFGAVLCGLLALAIRAGLRFHDARTAQRGNSTERR